MRLISIDCTWKFIHYFKGRMDMLFPEWAPSILKRSRWPNADQGRAQWGWHIAVLFGFIFPLLVTAPNLPVRSHSVFLIKIIVHRQRIHKEKHTQQGKVILLVHSPWRQLVSQCSFLLHSLFTPHSLTSLFPSCLQKTFPILPLGNNPMRNGIPRGKRSTTSIFSRVTKCFFQLHKFP